MMRYIQIALLVILPLTLVACSAKKEGSYPGTQEEQRREKIGKLTGEDGLIIIGKDRKQDESGATGIGINSYLWRASLDALSFMPLASADPFGGVIITDWYENPEAKGERYKINLVITSRYLRSDAVRASVFKQKYASKSGWKDTPVDNSVKVELENKILTRARQLRIAADAE